MKLAREPVVQLSCSFSPGHKQEGQQQQTLIVFLNGINIPHTEWYPIASILQKQLPHCPPILMYDRPNQGTSLGTNLDKPERPEGHGSDCLDAVHDLRELITSIATTRLNIPSSNIDNNLKLVLIASSVAVAIARLYASSYPFTIAGLVILDSTLANSDTVSLFPDPSSPDFRPENLPEVVTGELCADARKRIFPVYGSESRNPEGLWRGNLPALLPDADAPMLEGEPYVTVIQHDAEVFERQVMKVRRKIGSLLELLEFSRGE